MGNRVIEVMGLWISYLILTNADSCEVGLTHKAKELCVSIKVNFLSLQETKMESIELFDIKRCWGNFAFDYVHSVSVGNSGGILSVWDSNSFMKINATISDYFVMVRVDGFEKLVNEAWLEAPVDASNAMLNLMYKLKYLKKKIRAWNGMRKISKNSKFMLKMELVDLESIIDKGNASDDIITKRMELIDKDVMAAVKHFFQSGFIPKGVNSSFIALIPKSPDAKMVKEFRPISLIGSLYKIIAKILANRLVMVLGDIVNEVQSAFVADRQILDGPFILNEIFQWFVDAGMFKGIALDSSMQLSHMFYVDDAVFVGQWNNSNIDTIVHVLECFHRASGLRINMRKSKIIGIAVNEDRVKQAASKIGCEILKVPFSYLGSKVGGGSMSRIQSWNEIVEKMIDRLSKWKMKTLSIVDMGEMEKEKGGLGVSSLYALNRALMFKWVWRFTTQKTSLWARVIKAIHGEDKKIGKCSKAGHASIWRDIVQEMDAFKQHGTDLYSFMQKKLGDGANTSFWEDVWCENTVLKDKYPRLYALELNKNIKVAAKLAQTSMSCSFRREPRSGVEHSQLVDLLAKIEGVSLGTMIDRWTWALEGSGEFSVASVRKLIDDRILSAVSSKTRWIKAVPIKVNVLAWKVSLDCLPTRLNISRRGMDIASILCPICGIAVESSNHLFFDCHVARDTFRKICRWWDVGFMEVSSYEEWSSWILNIRISIKHKRLLEGTIVVYLEVTSKAPNLFVGYAFAMSIHAVSLALCFSVDCSLLVWLRYAHLFFVYLRCCPWLVHLGGLYLPALFYVLILCYLDLCYLPLMWFVLMKPKVDVCYVIVNYIKLICNMFLNPSLCLLFCFGNDAATFCDVKHRHPLFRINKPISPVQDVIGYQNVFLIGFSCDKKASKLFCLDNKIVKLVMYPSLISKYLLIIELLVLLRTCKDVVMGLVSSLLSGLVPLLKYTLEIVYSDISYLRIFRVETLFSILLENLMIPWLFRVCVLLLLWDDAYGSVSKTIFVPAVSPSKMMVLREVFSPLILVLYPINSC
ncbi:RNA-directed DNA polymerase, eukaryota, reverse transcriptase zinc-binding domain protein [Tanacetum coccineum]